MEKIDGGITAAKGFMASSTRVGLKKNSKNRDMAMIFSSSPAEVAGVFTTNLVKAAPVVWDKKIVDSGNRASVVIINSGIANACTGEKGMKICQETADEAAEFFGMYPENVLICSTGVIGQQIPMNKISEGIKTMGETLWAKRNVALEAAKAIMTTDTVPKESAVTFEIGGKKVSMGGMCKGSGMIHPNMCTMLCFIVTDCAISKALLQKALSDDVQDTFNMISVDGDTSTNDTVLLLANGQAGNPRIEEEGEDYRTFCEALHTVMEDLCKKIAGDGEGCTALFEVKVVHAADKAQARTLAKSVVTSSLTKAAIFGHDANWGRILCAMGYSGADFDPEKTDIWFESEGGSLQIVKDGTATDYSEEEATKILSHPAVTAVCDIKAGEETAVAWGCDLTYDYVKINADYRS